MSEYIKLDKTNPDRLTLRKNIVASHPDIAIQAAPEARQAVRELYSWLTSIYLPRRFPTTFQISPCLTQLTNLAANRSSQLIPLTPPTEPREMLKTLGENIDQDFLILLKDEKTCQYKLRAYVTCFPSGFNTKEKFGMKLSEIHGPVPRYGEKLEKSMDRFFDRIEVGKLVGRVNVWLSIVQRRYDYWRSQVGNNNNFGTVHAIWDTSLWWPGPERRSRFRHQGCEYDFCMLNPVCLRYKSFILLQVHLRVENQTLHRLPETKALVFSFKTYLYPLKDVKEEENGKVAEDLAQAIEGLRAGSVPEMWHYKRGVVWGERVCEYLRSWHHFVVKWSKDQ